MSDKPQTSELTIAFGEEACQAYLGGGFLGPEKSGAISWNWLSDRSGWCVLPGLDPTRDYHVTLDAAPLAFYSTTLWEFQLWAQGQQVARRIAPFEAAEVSIEVSMAELSRRCVRLPETLEWRLLKRDNPALRIFVNDSAAAEFEFESVPHVQTREFLLRHQLLGEKNVLRFEPNYALAQRDVDPSLPDERQLSFRMYRLRVRELEP